MYTTRDTYPKEEIRAVWLTTLNGLDWPRIKATGAEGRERQKQELCQMLDRLQQAHINTILLQTRIRGAVIYPSDIEPWDVAMTGKYDTDPGYDPLAYAIEQCHKRGMEVHAWVVTIPCMKQDVARKVGRKSVLNTHPELLRKHNDMYYLDPGLPGTADYLSSICQEVVRRYDVDGIHFDYIRYPENAGSFPDADTYRRYGAGMNKADWRRANITRIVTRIHDDVKAIKPWVRMSCSPIGKYSNLSRYSSRGWDAYNVCYQDAQGWLHDGVMDMLFPMMYFQGEHFFPFAADWQENCYGRPVMPGLGIYFLSPKEKNWPLVTVTSELEWTRTLGLGGQTYFRTQFLLENHKGLLDYVQDRFYPYQALPLPMTWQNSTRPAAPAPLQPQRVDGTHMQLRWQAVEDDGQPCRYCVYASATAPVDTSDPAHLVAIMLPEPHYTYNIFTQRMGRLHYAVTALDRYDNESEATQLY